MFGKMAENKGIKRDIKGLVLYGCCTQGGRMLYARILIKKSRSINKEKDQSIKKKINQ